MYALMLAGMMVILSVGIVSALSFSLATDNQIEYGVNLWGKSSREGTGSLLQLSTQE